MENKDVEVDRTVCAKNQRHQTMSLVMHTFSKTNTYDEGKKAATP